MADSGRKLRVRRYNKKAFRTGVKALAYQAGSWGAAIGGGIALGMGALPVTAGAAVTSATLHSMGGSSARTALSQRRRARMIEATGRANLLRKASRSISRRKSGGSAKRRSSGGPRGFANPRVQAAAQRGRRAKR